MLPLQSIDDLPIPDIDVPSASIVAMREEVGRAISIGWAFMCLPCKNLITSRASTGQP